jgi:chaperonin GroES
MKFRPLHDCVVVKRIDAEQKSAGGIIIPDTAKEKPSQGEIIGVGPGGRDETGKLSPIDLKVGDTVLFGKWSGTEVKLDCDALLIMKEFDVMGVIEWRCRCAQEGRLSRSSITQKKEIRPWLQKTSNFPSTLGTACCAASISWPTL